MCTTARWASFFEFFHNPYDVSYLMKLVLFFYFDIDVMPSINSCSCQVGLLVMHWYKFIFLFVPFR